MKKLLAMLSSLILANSAAIPVLSFAAATSQSDFVSKTAKYYSLVTAHALKGAILNDQTLEIKGKETSIQYQYASKYYAIQKIKDVFGSLYAPDQTIKPGDNDLVSTYYKSVFGDDQGGVNYDISKNFNDLIKNNGLKLNSNLYKIASGSVDKNSPIGVKPDSNVQEMISAVVGGAKVALGNDFSAGLASLIVGLLQNDKVSSAINTNDVKDIFSTIDGMLTDNQSELKLTMDDLTQSNATSEDTIETKLTSATNNLFAGLIFFISGQSYTYTGKDKDNKPLTTTASEAFWDYLLNGKSDALTPADKTKKMNNMITSGAGIIDFAMTLVHYFRAFDETYKITLNSSATGDHLFSKDKTNAQVKAEILQEKYLDDSDKYWYVDGDTHYMKLNLQNLFSDLSYCLSNQASNGYQLLRPINILLGDVDDGTNSAVNKDKYNLLNPITKTALSPLLKIAKDKITSALSSLYNIPVIGGKLPTADQIGKLLDTTTSNLFDWIATDGYVSGQTKIYLKTISSAINLIPAHFDLSPFKDALKDNYKTAVTILKVVQGVGEFLNSSSGKQFIDHPWKSLYSGKIFSRIAANSYAKNASTSSLRKLFNNLGKLKDLQYVLTSMHIDELVNTITSIANVSWSLPDWLYSLKDYKISTLIDHLAKTNYMTTGEKTLKDNQSYSISAEALKDIVSSLIPHEDTDNSAIRITATDKDGKTTQVSPIWPIFYAIVYSHSNIDLTDKDMPYDYSIKLPDSDDSIQLISKKPFKDKNGNYGNVNKLSLNYLLGVMTKDDQTNYFTKSSIFEAISKLYGHNYANHKDYLDMSQGAQSVFGLANWFSTLAANSISETVNDYYLKYLDAKNWNVVNIKSDNLSPSSDDENTVQHIQYDIDYKNPYLKKVFRYHVHLTRHPYSSDAIGWVVDELMLQ